MLHQSSTLAEPITPSQESQAGSLRCPETSSSEAESSKMTVGGGYSSRACICKSERFEGITSTASSSYSIAVLRNKLFLFLPFSLPSLFIIFINVMIQCLASPTLSLSAFTGAMSREGHCGHHENSIVLITAMIDRLCYKMSGERGWDIGKAELRNRERTVHRRMEVWHMNAEQMRWSKTKEKGEVTEGKIK